MTPEQRYALEQKLTEAEDAYHSLILGKQGKVFVDANGERVETTPANAARLQAYIFDLKRQLGLVQTGPFGVYF